MALAIFNTAAIPASPLERKPLQDVVAATQPVRQPYDDTVWIKTFGDEFDTFERYDGQNGAWQTQYHWGRIKGQEQQVYVDLTMRGPDGRLLGLHPFRLTNGVLTIISNPTPPSMLDFLKRPYISGMITTFPTFSQTYGFFEIRAKVPAGRGLWPGFWLLPADKSWPPELDVLEMLGKDPFTLYQGIHTGESGSHQARIFKTQTPDLSAAFHVYGMEWSETTITYYFDGNPIGTNSTPKDLHQPMYIVANLAIGGDAWPGVPDETNTWPAEYQIDYIRVYRKR